ncbi:MAG: hypothetical protein ASARMPRED_007582 [Alectoria sarmentosa]|nr:MAG: hypothetical protein ASARMPRED_007582 [Alectoria sarmentosa]
MADRNKAHTIQVGPVSKITAPDDPLSLLPKELLDNIYSLALHSEDGPWTFHIKSTVQPWRYGSNNDLDRLLSLLALPQDRRYKARRMKNPDEVWPDNVERACFVALDWAYRYKGGYHDDLISEIIYELTGIRLCRKEISSHIQLLKNWAYDMEPASKHILAEVLRPGSALRYLNSTDHIETITFYIQDIQAKLPKLLGAFKKEHKAAILLPPKPVVLLRPLSSFTVTANAGILRLLSTIASDPTSILSTSIHPPRPSNLSLNLTNRFHRTHPRPRHPRLKPHLRLRRRHQCHLRVPQGKPLANSVKPCPSHVRGRIHATLLRPIVGFERPVCPAETPRALRRAMAPQSCAGG